MKSNIELAKERAVSRKDLQACKPELDMAEFAAFKEYQWDMAIQGELLGRWVLLSGEERAQYIARVSEQWREWQQIEKKALKYLVAFCLVFIFEHSDYIMQEGRGGKGQVRLSSCITNTSKTPAPNKHTLDIPYVTQRDKVSPLALFASLQA